MSKKIQLIDMIYAALFAVLISILGYLIIPLPFSPVPLTGQTLAVMLAGSVLSPLQAGLSLITFIFMGIIGLPVFSGGASGIGVIVGSNGGYLIGFLVGAIIISLIKNKSNSIPLLIVANILGGIIIVYISGVLWLSFITKMGIYKAFTLGALPFIPGDIIKAIIATFIAKRINTLRRKAVSY
jgi:biotin transport system substrate-specific component